MRENKFLQWLKRPKGAWLAVIYCFTAILCGAAIAAAFIKTEWKVIEIVFYVVYALAAIFLGYSVYTIVIYFPTLKNSVTAMLKKNAFIANVMDNYGFKTLVFAICSLALTLAYVVINIVSAFKYKLVWYFAISAYYLILLIFRGCIILADRNCAKKLSGAEYEISKWKIYKLGGIIVTVLELAMAVAITEAILMRRPMRGGQIMTIATAAYTFYKMAMSIYNLLKAKKFNQPVVQALRNITFADACMSVVSLTVLMLSTFGEPDGFIIMRASVGFAVCAIIIVLAILMIVKANSQLKLLKEKDKNARE